MLEGQQWSEAEEPRTSRHHGVVLAFLVVFLVAVALVGSHMV